MLTLTVAGESEPDPSAQAWDAQPVQVPVNIWADESGEVFARGYISGPLRWVDWRGLGRFTFQPGSTVVHVRACANASPQALRGTFDRVIQPVILQALGWQALHASGVIGPSGAVLFCGMGRSGKSTLAYAAGRRAGYRQFADDAVVIEADGERMRACPLPFATGLRQDADRMLRSSGAGPSSLLGPVVPVGLPEPKTDLEDQTALRHAEDRKDSFAVRSVFVLSQDPAAPADVRIDRIAPADAFALLLTHAHCFDEADRTATRPMVETYLAFADHVPVLALTYRPDFAKLDALVDAVLTAAASERS